MMDNTPIYDIQPYIAYTYPDATGGFTDQYSCNKLEVNFPKHWLRLIPSERQEALICVLALDPRPSYQNDPDRIYGFEFGGFEVKFTVQDTMLSVCKVESLTGTQSTPLEEK